MKNLVIVLLFIAFRSVAQDHPTINFIKDLSWEETKQKASKANKIIFLDAYTTWCVPCKEMEANIFPQKKVADFFNENFINYQVQMDQSANDSELIKLRHADAKQIEQTYAIKSYPTYLFLNPDGVLIHFFLGSSTDADDFINKAKVALDPNNQYIKLRDQFTKGRRDTPFIKSLIANATSVNDQLSKRLYIQALLQSQENLLTKENMMLIAQSARASGDIGFKELTTHKNEFISVIGAGWRNNIISNVAFDEYLIPLLKIGGKKEVLGGGMTIYSGEMNPNVDWKAVENIVHEKFGSDADRVLVGAETTYHRWNADWKNYNLSLKKYVAKNTLIDTDFICNSLQNLVFNCKDDKELKGANGWISAAAKQKDFSCTKVYGNYLFRMGNFKEAKKVLTNYQSTLGQSDKEVSDLLEKISVAKH